MLSNLKNSSNIYEIIFETVTKNRIALQESATKCKQLFEQKNIYFDPNILVKLEEVLKARQDENLIIKQMQKSKQKNIPKTLNELKNILEIKKEDYEYYIYNFLPVLRIKIAQSEKLSKLPVLKKENEKSSKLKTRKDEILEIILSIINKVNYVKDYLDNKSSEKSKENSNITLGKFVDIYKFNGGASSHKLNLGKKSSTFLKMSERDTDTNVINDKILTVKEGNSFILLKKKEINDQLKFSEKIKKYENIKENENLNLNQINQYVNTDLQKRKNDNKTQLFHEKIEKENKKYKKKIEFKKQFYKKNFCISLITICTIFTIGCYYFKMGNLGNIAKIGLFLAISSLFFIQKFATYFHPSSKLTSVNLNHNIIDDSKQL